MSTFTSNPNVWRVAPGDPTCVFAPGVAKPIQCGSQKAASLIVTAVNAYCRACKGTGWIEGAPGEPILCDCRSAHQTSEHDVWCPMGSPSLTCTCAERQRAQKATGGMTPCFASGRVCEARADTGVCEHTKAMKACEVVRTNLGDSGCIMPGDTL